MPWRRRYRWRPRRPYWIRYRHWRPRKIIRRRRWRRRVRYPYKKLKKITLKQWQPNKIRLCKITGLMPLFLCNKYKLGNNYAIYNQAIVPTLLPGGGGFSIYQYTLENLYIMHQYCRNWWTQPNNKLPLVRYVKCKMKIYQADDVDIVFRYINHPPLTANQLTYPTTQPSMLMMLRNSIMIPSKRTEKLKKPYKKITIYPPKLMTNKWFFQQDLAKKPLLLTLATAASFDHYFIGTDKMSTNTSVACLNTILIQNLEFTKKPLYNIRTDGTLPVWLWAAEEPPKQTGGPTAKYCILLANTQKYTEGWSFEDFKRYSSVSQTQKTWSHYKENIHIYAGNPFHTFFLDTENEHFHNFSFYQTRSQDPHDALPQQETQPLKDATIIHNPFIYWLRYSPNADKGDTNKAFLLLNYKPKNGWEPPTDPKLILEGFPLYILLWGYLDFQKQQHLLNNIDTSTILALQTSTIHGAPTTLPALVPLGEDFIKGKSPFEPAVNPLDSGRWYPQVQYQEQAVNNILSTGPGVAKLNGKNTVEAKCLYTFYFKFGGDPAPMVEVQDPTNQPKFPVTDQFIQTNSLQDPTTPAELFLYNFDQRRSTLTKKAEKRMQKDWETKQYIFTDGTTAPGPPQIQESTPETSDTETSDSEKEEEKILQLLIKQRKKQHNLKQRIRQLLTIQQNIE
nr:MAG: ORF1 [TTV-like mini virus]